MNIWELRAKLREIAGAKGIMRMPVPHCINCQPPATEISSVVTKFGGLQYLKAALQVVGFEVNASTLYRWANPYSGRNRGTGQGSGKIPDHAWPGIIMAADYCGVKLGPEDGYRPHMRMFALAGSKAKAKPGPKKSA